MKFEYNKQQFEIPQEWGIGEYVKLPDGSYLLKDTKGLRQVKLMTAPNHYHLASLVS